MRAPYYFKKQVNEHSYIKLVFRNGEQLFTLLSTPPSCSSLQSYCLLFHLPLSDLPTCTILSYFYDFLTQNTMIRFSSLKYKKSSSCDYFFPNRHLLCRAFYVHAEEAFGREVTPACMSVVSEHISSYRWYLLS